jgi:4-hydroxy-tetrahydrodipicolinate reductase
MGKVIEQLALERGHEISLKINRSNLNEFTQDKLKSTDVAIEFSTPEVGFLNVKQLIEWGVPTISGTTGWKDKLDEINALAEQNKVGFIYASNFSLGVNLFFALNEYLAKLMRDQPYSPEIEEIHHTSKKDSPSGTAISLAEQIMATTSFKGWTNDTSDQDNIIPILSKRIDPAPGTHTVTYNSEIDTISINHTAHTRKGFALGSIIAAEWIVNKHGVFTMKDVLGLTTPR